MKLSRTQSTIHIGPVNLRGRGTTVVHILEAETNFVWRHLWDTRTQERVKRFVVADNPFDKSLPLSIYRLLDGGLVLAQGRSDWAGVGAAVTFAAGTTSDIDLKRSLVTEQLPEGEYAGLPLNQDSGEYFSASGVCALCHDKMVDESGVDVSISSYWRSTLHANAARDPYWQASMAAEIEENPEIEDTIQDTCAKCHVPMARFSAAAEGEPVVVVGDGGR